MALHCVDYKVFAKVVANRLKSYLASIVHKDQTYCVPGHSITDNLFLIRDMFLASVKRLYAGASSMVKVGGALSRPVWVRQGH